MRILLWGEKYEKIIFLQLTHLHCLKIDSLGSNVTKTDRRCSEPEDGLV